MFVGHSLVFWQLFCRLLPSFHLMVFFLLTHCCRCDLLFLIRCFLSVYQSMGSIVVLLSFILRKAVTINNARQTSSQQMILFGLCVRVTDYNKEK